MRRKLSYSLLLLWSVFFSANAQKFELGKVSVKELEEKNHPLDTSASAAVLYNKAKSSFAYSQEDGFSIIHEFEMRIKIYKKEGLQYANYDIPYRVNYENLKSDNLSISDVATYNLINGKVDKTKLSGEGKFKENVNKNWRVATIALPNVKEGSVIEYKYTIKTQNIGWFPPFIFQRSIPVNFVEYRTEIPVYYIYKPVIKGFIDIKHESVVGNGHQNYNTKHEMRTESLTYKQLENTHTATNVPALINENFVDNLDNYRGVISYELAMIRFPDKKEEDLSRTWEGVVKTIYDSDRFGKQLDLKEYYEGDLRALLKGLETQQEKVNAIFNYVKVKMNWDKTYGIFTDKGVQKAYLDRTGNAAEINFILASMLNSAGFIASPVLVSTVDNGITSLPNQTAFNYIIVSTEVEGKKFLLDATNKFSSPNVIPPYALNWVGRVVSKSGNSSEVDLVPAFNSKSVYNVMANIDKQGVIKGKTKIQLSDYKAFDFREQHSNQNRDNYLEELEKKMNGIKIDNYVIENENNLLSPIQQTFDFTTDRQIDIIGDKMYLNPMLFFTAGKNPFNQEKRQCPVYFGYPTSSKYTFTLDIPEGYQIESVPQPIAFTTGENVASFKCNLQATGNRIQIVVSLDLNKMVVLQDFYPVLKDFFQKMIEKQNEKVVLKKV